MYYYMLRYRKLDNNQLLFSIGIFKQNLGIIVPTPVPRQISKAQTTQYRFVEVLLLNMSVYVIKRI